MCYAWNFFNFLQWSICKEIAIVRPSKNILFLLFFLAPTPLMAGGPWRADAVAETTCNLWSNGKLRQNGEKCGLDLAGSLIHHLSVSLCFLRGDKDIRLFPSPALREFCWNVTCSPPIIFSDQYICIHGCTGVQP